METATARAALSQSTCPHAIVGLGACGKSVTANGRGGNHQQVKLAVLPAPHRNQRNCMLRHNKYIHPLRISSSSSSFRTGEAEKKAVVPCRKAATAAGKGLSSSKRTMVVAMADSDDGAVIPSLDILPMKPYVNGRGQIRPYVEPNTEASIFVVYDFGKNAQYVGFSKDVRNSLRTLIGRRPGVCFYYRIFNLPSLDQQKMLAVRSKWYAELGEPPVGNAEAEERLKWEKPFDAKSVVAAKKRAAEIGEALQDRGVREVMEFDPVLLDQGKCDILPSIVDTSDDLTAEEEAENARAEASKLRHISTPGPTGEQIEFDIYYQNKFVTNGGWMYDVKITSEEKETRHRVIIAKIYPESVSVTEDEFIERTFAFLLAKKLPRQTEGMLTSKQFPVNYFSVSEVEQWYDDFKGMFADGAALLPGEAGYWRFNRLHHYGPRADSMPFVGPED